MLSINIKEGIQKRVGGQGSLDTLNPTLQSLELTPQSS
jgi:hypothetical protein